MKVAKIAAAVIGAGDDVVVVCASAGVSGIGQEVITQIHSFVIWIIDFNEFALGRCYHELGNQKFQVVCQGIFN